MKFDIYSHTKMSDFIITNIQWDDHKKKQLKYIYPIQLMGNGNYLENTIKKNNLGIILVKVHLKEKRKMRKIGRLI